jgi:hypothetical protein
MNNIRHIITPSEISAYARPCDADEDSVDRAIEEAESMDIRPKIGDALFLQLGQHTEFSRLLEGGDYKDSKGETHLFQGLKAATAYYAWGRLVKSATSHLTRFGFVEKKDDYSQQTEWKERQVAYNDAFAVADKYMTEIADYMQSQPQIFEKYTLQGEMKANRVIVRIIGN